MADQQDQNPDYQTAQKTDGKKSKKMKASSTKGDAIDKGKTLLGRTELNPSGRPDSINMNPIYTHVNNSFENNFGDDLNELNNQQRLKKALNFKRLKGKIQLARKKSMSKKGSGKVIAKRAKVLAIKIIKMKLAGNRKISDLSSMEKQRVEKIMDKASSDGVNRLALRLIPSVKKREAKRFLNRESIDLNNLSESVNFINEIVNCASGGGVRGMGHMSGNPDGEPTDHIDNNITDANELLNYINQLMQDHNDMHYSDNQHDENIAPDSDTKDNIMKGTKNGAKAVSKMTKENIHDDSYLRLDSKGSTTLLYKNDTPGEPKSSESAIRKAGPKLQKMPKVQEAETREAVPRSGQPRKSIQNVVRDSVCRCMSTGPYRQQSIQKKIIDETSYVDKVVSSVASSAKKAAMKASGLDELDPHKIVNDTLDSVGAKEIVKILTPPKRLKEAKMGNPCWKGYKAYGMKKKNGKSVPNCVPVKEGLDEAFETLDEVAAWQRKEGKRESGGLNQKGVDSYRREHPGSKLKTAVTTKPSKLDPDSKAAKRRKSFCARMSGMKKQNTSAKTANDPDSRINKSLRKWNC